MDFDLISRMNVEELKKYLRLRALRVSGRKEELVARVFSAVERNVQPVKTATEIEEELSKEYQYKLTLDEVTIPGVRLKRRAPHWGTPLGVVLEKIQTKFGNMLRTKPRSSSYPIDPRPPKG